MAALVIICSVVNVEVEGAVEITKVVSLVTNKLIDLARSQVQRNNKITNNRKRQTSDSPAMKPAEAVKEANESSRQNG